MDNKTTLAASRQWVPSDLRVAVQQHVLWAGIALILATGLIHLFDAPSSFDDATYKGVLFVANGLGTFIAAFNISRGMRIWGWGLGLVVAGSAFVAYIISRTVGLPGLSPDTWLEPLGVASLIVEGGFVALALYVLTNPSTRLTSVRRNHAS